MNDNFTPQPLTASRPTEMLPPPVPPAPIGRSRLQIDCSLAYQLDGDCHFMFLVQAMMDGTQSVIEEALSFDPPTPFRAAIDPASGNRFVRLNAKAGAFTMHYRAMVDKVVVAHDVCAPEVPVHEIPDDLMHFLLPTRYCESDHLGATAQQLFGSLPQGFARVQAIADWVRTHIAYRIGSSQATTTARDVLQQQAGVCRDFAHLCITFCRAVNIPARLVCGYATFPDPPPDFHAIFEAYLGGHWVPFDPTGMAPVDQVVRIATGRDAKDVAFATIYGPARMVSMSPAVTLIEQGVA